MYSIIASKNYSQAECMELSESDFSQKDMVPCQTKLILVPSIEGSHQKAFSAADRDGTPSISFQKL